MLWAARVLGVLWRGTVESVGFLGFLWGLGERFLGSGGQEVGGDVVASWDEDIGDLDGFLEGGLGGFAVGTLEDLSGLDVFDGGEGVAADEGGGGGL